MTMTDFNPNNIALEDHVLTPDGLALVLDIDQEARTVRVIHNSAYAGPNTKEMDYTVEYCITQVEKVQEWAIIYEDKFAKPGAMPRVYTIRETTESQLPQLLSSLKAKLHEEYLETCKTWTPEAWQKQFNAPLRDTSDTLQAVTIEQWFQMEREHLLGNAELHMETYREFMDALEVLPPQKWQCDADLGFERFLMSEYWTGSYTTQHACVTHQGKHICASRMVDARDKSTWITREEVFAAYVDGEVPETLFSEQDIDEHLKRARKEAKIPGEGLNWHRDLGYKDEHNRFDMAACVEVIDGNETYIERADDVDLNRLHNEGTIHEFLFTIYAYKVDGECAAIADFRTKQDAEYVYKRLNEALCDPYNF
jgi:hypothetical protein